LLRLADDRAVAKIEIIDRLLTAHAADLPERFFVVTERSIRVTPPLPA
jgi:hypothetical protein